MSLAALAAVAVCLLVAAGPAGAVPRDFWGVVPQKTPTASQFERLKRGGVDSIRTPIPWSGVEPSPGAFEWDGPDTVVAAAAVAGMDVLPFLYSAPRWAVPSAVVPGSRGRARAPRFLPVRNGRQRAGWKRFVRQAALRYGPRGSFWAENPGLPRRPIRTWQIWNEANFKYFVVRPNPVEFGKLVKLSYQGLRSADRRARLLLGGLFAYPAEARYRRRPKQAYTAVDFLNIMYRRMPGIRRFFHGVSLHPYTGTYRRLPLYIRELRRVLKAHRDGGKGLWITELGWSSQPPRRNNSFAKGLRGQAAQLRGAFRLLRKRQRPWRVRRVYWFSVDDLEGACNFCDGSGLFSAGFVPKPAWHAFVRFAGGRAG